MTVPHQLIASPYPGGHLVVSPGREGGIKIGVNKYAELRDAAPAAPVPGWLAAAARAQWDQDVTGLTTAGAVVVRPETPYGYARASYELNLGCNYDFLRINDLALRPCHPRRHVWSGMVRNLYWCVDRGKPYPCLGQE
jgi:hypothetical protein